MFRPVFRFANCSWLSPLKMSFLLLGSVHLLYQNCRLWFAPPFCVRWYVSELWLSCRDVWMVADSWLFSCMQLEGETHSRVSLQLSRISCRFCFCYPMINTVLLQLLNKAKFNSEIVLPNVSAYCLCLLPEAGVFFYDILFVRAVVRGLRPANGILQLHWTLQHLRMQWSRFILIMLVIW